MSRSLNNQYWSPIIVNFSPQSIWYCLFFPVIDIWVLSSDSMRLPFVPFSFCWHAPSLFSLPLALCSVAPFLVSAPLLSHPTLFLFASLLLLFTSLCLSSFTAFIFSPSFWMHHCQMVSSLPFILHPFPSSPLFLFFSPLSSLLSPLLSPLFSPLLSPSVLFSSPLILGLIIVMLWRDFRASMCYAWIQITHGLAEAVMLAGLVLFVTLTALVVYELQKLRVFWLVRCMIGGLGGSISNWYWSMIW